MLADAIKRTRHVHAGLLPDFDAQRLEVCGSLKQFCVDRTALGVREVELCDYQGFDLADSPINRCVSIIWMRNGMLNDSAQDQQSAADAAAGTQGKDQRQQQNGFPA